MNCKHCNAQLLPDCECLTPWRLGGFGDFRKKNSSFRFPYQRPSSSANCARELFSGLNGSASVVDCTRKKFFGCTKEQPSGPLFSLQSSLLCSPPARLNVQPTDPSCSAFCRPALLCSRQPTENANFSFGNTAL